MVNRAFVEWYGSFTTCCCCTPRVGLFIAALLELGLWTASPITRSRFIPWHQMLTTEVKELNHILFDVLFFIHLARKIFSIIGGMCGVEGLALQAPKALLLFWLAILVDIPLGFVFCFIYFIAFQWKLPFALLLGGVCICTILLNLWLSALIFSYSNSLRSKSKKPVPEQKFLIANELV